MEQNLPKFISNDKDLNLYESFLNKESNRYKKYTHTDSLLTFSEYLKNKIGSTVKIDILISNRNHSKTGALITVGTDFIVIKPSNTSYTTAIALKDIKFLNILKEKPYK